MRWAISAGLAVLVGVGACRKNGESKESASAPAAAAPAGAWTVTGNDARAALFVQKGCPQCHSIAALGIKSAAEVGPDLTTAYAEVRSRFGVSLEEFLPNPTGTMQMVLSSMIQLTPVERDSIVRILKELHEDAEDEREPRH